METENVRYRLSQDAIFKSLKDAIIWIHNNIKVLEANKKLKTYAAFHRRRLLEKISLKLRRNAIDPVLMC